MTTSSEGFLLDSSLLIALVVESHEHHDAAVAWFDSHGEPFWTSPITQGALLRVTMRLGEGASFRTAQATLSAVLAHPRHRFLSDDLSFDEVSLPITGAGQVTDAYLIALASHHRLALATLDHGQAQIDPAATFLVR